jgi:23S rRNA pseudouridine1911/1915/1917 synthase
MSEETFVVPEDAPTERADKLLAGHFSEVSRGAIQRAIDKGRIRLQSGQFIQSKHKLHPGDVLLVDLVPETGPSLNPVEIPLEILHEDKYIVVVNKPSGMVVHPGDGTGDDTLVHALLHHCQGNLSPVGAPDRPGVVHRLDKETSGAIVVAKTEVAHHDLVTQFSNRETEKQYLALVLGVPSDETGSIQLPIGRHPKVRVKMAVCEKGKKAHTEWQVLESFGQDFALLKCIIHTGRTHQIRVHLAHMGHVIAGDRTYGYKDARNDAPRAQRVLLHAETLGFAHPANREKVAFKVPLPDDFSEYLSGLREQFGGDAVT